MHRHLVQTVGRGVLVDRIDRAVIVVRLCARGVREMFVFNVDDVVRRICTGNNYSLLGPVSVGPSKIFDCKIQRVAKVNDDDAFSRHSCMMFGLVLMKSYLN